MLPLCDLLALAVLLAAQPGPWTAASRAAPQKGCASCRGLRGPAPAEAGTSSLAVGSPAGVHPELRPGTALRAPSATTAPSRRCCRDGGCAPSTSKPAPPRSPSRQVHTLHTVAPCRKLLNTVLRHLEPTHFPANRDIYIPNCDTRGFYRKKQCHSSKGMQRGQCWCVDEHGTPLRNGEDGVLPCDGD
ncbi:hypothetical protein ANANG_G00218980 [Anguilla anguilla]|uniref:Thyroglobulin type-1 domain-containing protein n=1 Tax=Anguilla anguilla TaxID=7936 RepID=A0A9D3RPW1_ANGAN|nr:hypothetical protein ANANG_G00218980 [Anguilla anguilla]